MGTWILRFSTLPRRSLGGSFWRRRRGGRKPLQVLARSSRAFVLPLKQERSPPLCHHHITPCGRGILFPSKHGRLGSPYPVFRISSDAIIAQASVGLRHRVRPAGHPRHPRKRRGIERSQRSRRLGANGEVYEQQHTRDHQLQQHAPAGGKPECRGYGVLPKLGGEAAYGGGAIPGADQLHLRCGVDPRRPADGPSLWGCQNKGA